MVGKNRQCWRVFLLINREEALIDQLALRAVGQMLVWDPQEGYDHVLNGVRHHFDSKLQRKRKNCYAVTALRRLFTLP